MRGPRSIDWRKRDMTAAKRRAKDESTAKVNNAVHQSKMTAKKPTRRELRIAKARAEARTLLQELRPLDLEPAEDYLRANPPSLAAIAFLPWLVPEAQAVVLSAKNSQSARAKRRSRVQRVRDSGARTLNELVDKDPNLVDEVRKEHQGDLKPLYDLLSKANAKQKSP